MIIGLHPPLGIYGQGRREQNQDSIYPSLNESGNGERIFIICDGVGGAVRGEEASRLVCEVFALYFQKREFAAKADFGQALKLAEMAIDEFIKDNHDAEGMATTLVLLYLHEEGATIGHIGDSRVYHIRNGKILFKTHDHSLINELLAGNIITQEEADYHPGRNVISRAITGTGRPTEVELTNLTDVQPGDYFFLCSDGILESFTDDDLTAILGSEDMDNNEKSKLISDTCLQHSRDNYSAWLLSVSQVTKNTPEWNQ